MALDDEFTAFPITLWSDMIRRGGGDADRQRFLDDFVRRRPKGELYAKVFFELQYRINHGQRVEAIAAYARQVLSLPAAVRVDATDDAALENYVSALLMIGLMLSNGDPGVRAAKGPADPQLAALAIEAFLRVEPWVQDQRAMFLAEFDLYVAHALKDCERLVEATARARRALDRADATLVGFEGGVYEEQQWMKLKQETEALLAEAKSGE